jgi:hypothetical protein
MSSRDRMPVSWSSVAKIATILVTVAGAALGGRYTAAPSTESPPPIGQQPITRAELDAKFETVNIKIGAVDDKVTRIDAKLDRVLEKR